MKIKMLKFKNVFADFVLQKKIENLTGPIFKIDTLLSLLLQNGKL